MSSTSQPSVSQQVWLENPSAHHDNHKQITINNKGIIGKAIIASLASGHLVQVNGANGSKTISKVCKDNCHCIPKFH